MERRRFIGSAAGLAGSFSLSATGISGGLPLNSQDKNLKLKGGANPLVKHWDIITIGNLSRNRYWGESDEKPLHNAICTCTVISGEGFHIIVDPSLADEKAMANELGRRTGLTPGKIDAVFITHQHGDHIAGLKYFPTSRWLAGRSVASALNKSGELPKQIEIADTMLFKAVEVIATPGHTPDHCSLRFDYHGLSVVIAGDSVATRDFWDDRRMYYNVMDMEESVRTMDKISSIADIIVPGHDNSFFNL